MAKKTYRFILTGPRRQDRYYLTPTAWRKKMVVPLIPGMADDACWNCGHSLMEYGVVLGTNVACENCGQLYEVGVEKLDLD